MITLGIALVDGGKIPGHTPVTTQDQKHSLLT